MQIAQFIDFVSPKPLCQHIVNALETVRLCECVQGEGELRGNSKLMIGSSSQRGANLICLP